MPSTLLAVTFDAHDPVAQARFWGGLLGREAVPDGDGVLLPGDPTQVGLRFTPTARAKTVPNRVHLHLTSDRTDQLTVVESVLRSGGRHLDVGQGPGEDHVVLADPEGNELCVIEPGNGYLAGTGFLGEVGCDGTRAVGIFWSEALGWPLVWDQNQETAIQSPSGGTKIAWGGPPVPPIVPSTHQRFELVASDLATEVDRLVSLGARRVRDSDGVVVLADPDGNEFRLRAG